MSAVTTDVLARKWARQLEKKEADRHGIPLVAARARVARRVGATPGTLENLSRNRLKGVREWLFSNLRSAVLSEIEREIAALEHEKATLVALGRQSDFGALAEVETGLARLRRLLTDGEVCQ